MAFSTALTLLGGGHFGEDRLGLAARDPNEVRQVSQRRSRHPRLRRLRRIDRLGRRCDLDPVTVRAS